MARLQTSYGDSLDDEEEQRRTLDALLQLDGPAPASADGPMPDEMRDDRGSSPRWTDPDLSPMQLQHRPDPETPDNAEQADKTAGGMVNDLSVLAALIADVAGNKGRGASSIVSAFGNNIARSQQAGVDHRHRLEEIGARNKAVGGGGSRGGLTPEQVQHKMDMDDWRETERVRSSYADEEQRAKQLGLQEQSLEHRRDAYSDKTNLDSDLNQTDIAKAAAKAEGTTRAREETKLELAPRTIEAATDRARSVASASTEARGLANSERPLSAGEVETKTRAERTEGERLDKEETTRRLTEQDRFRSDAKTYPAALSAARRLTKRYDDMLVADPDADLPGLGKFDSSDFSKEWNPMRDASADADLNVVRTFIQQPLTGASTGGIREDKRFDALAGRGGSPDDKNDLAALKTLQQLIGSDLKSMGSGREKYVKPLLDEQGLGDLIDVPREVAAPPRQLAAPDLQILNTPDNLGTTHQSRDRVPALPADARVPASDPADSVMERFKQYKLRRAGR